MATQEDSGLVDRRSIRELIETSVGGARAPLNAKAQLRNQRRLDALRKKEQKRLKMLLKKRQQKMQQEQRASS